MVQNFLSVFISGLLMLAALVPLTGQPYSSVTDSLEQTLEVQTGSEKLTTLFHLVRLVPFDQKAELLTRADELVEPGSFNDARLQREWAIYHVLRHELSACYHRLEAGRKIHEKLDEKKEFAYLNHMYVELFSVAYDNLRAREYGLEALNLAEQTGDEELIGYSYLALSRTVPYELEKDEYIHKAISFLSRVESRFLPHAYNNLGYRYYLTGVPDSSLYYYQLALELKQGNNDPTVTNTAENMADLFLAQKEFDKALEITAEHLPLVMELQDQERHLGFLLVQTEAYIGLNQIPEAQLTMARADTVFQSFSLPIFEVILEYYKTKKLVSAAGQDSEAYIQYDQIYMQYQDSLQIRKDSVFNSQLRIQKDLFEKESEIDLLNQELSYRKYLNSGLFGLIILGIIVLGLLWRTFRTKRKFEHKRVQLLAQQTKLDQLEIQNLRHQQTLTETEQKRVEEMLDYRKRQVSSSLVMIRQKNELLRELADQLEEGMKQSSGNAGDLLRRVKHKIEYQLQADQDWEKLKMQFEEIHPEFFSRLLEKYPTISQTERRLCAFIRLQMTNKEIARFMGVNSASVLKSRYRLRKKLQLGKAEDLSNFIINF